MEQGSEKAERRGREEGKRPKDVKEREEEGKGSKRKE